VSFPGQHAVGTSEQCARLGLLTAILHETGQALGLADAYEPTDRNEVMYGSLTVGARRVPVRGQVTKNARDSELLISAMSNGTAA
jgi:hypothetical protein